MGKVLGKSVHSFSCKFSRFSLFERRKFKEINSSLTIWISCFFQVNSWLQWLETADEEDESDEEQT